MISSVLPGFREARTPLLAGALWFVIVWFVVGGERLSPQDDSGTQFARETARLIELAGPAITLAAISAAALLIGALIPPVPDWVAELLLLRSSTRDDVNDLREDLARTAVAGGHWRSEVTWQTLTATSRQVPRALRSAADLYTGGFAAAGIHDMRIISIPLSRDIAESDEAEGIPSGEEPIEPSALEQCLNEALGDELELLAARLQVEHQELYLDVDRIQSESMLRRSLAIPLLVLCIIAGALATWWALIAVALPFALLAQSAAKDQAAELRIYTAVAQGLITSPSLDYIVRWGLDELGNPLPELAPRGTPIAWEDSPEAPEAPDTQD